MLSLRKMSASRAIPRLTELTNFVSESNPPPFCARRLASTTFILSSITHY
jgi:hypothetical protein